MIGGKDRDDVYQVDLLEGSKVQFSLNNVSQGTSLQLFDRNGNAIGASNGSASNGSASNGSASISKQLGAGTFYVKVSSNSRTKTRYTLEMTTGLLGLSNNDGGSNGSGGGSNGDSRGFPRPNGSSGSGSSSSTYGETGYFLRLTRTNTKGSDGLENLNLTLMNGNKVVDKVSAISGVAGKQAFRRSGESRSGSMEPLPEGKWSLGGVEWASAKNNYSASWGEGLGPVWVSVEPKMSTQRSAIGIHLDANYRYSPGTMGCIGIENQSDLQEIVSWFDSYAPKTIVVDWNLGTV